MNILTKLLWIISFNLVIVFAEILFGAISNSYALIADALHNAGDVLAVAITYIAIKFSMKKPSFRYTFGFIKAQALAGFVNMLFLYITMAYVTYEAVFKLFDDTKVEPLYMIVVGFIAFVANIVSAYILHSINISSCAGHDHSHHDHDHNEDINIKSAYFHMLSDALISVGVVVAGVFIYYFDIFFIDSLLAILFCVYIVFHSFDLLKKSFFALMDFNTTEITIQVLDDIILHDKLVLQYHDLHISSPNNKQNYISFHIVLNDPNTTLEVCETVNNTIKEKLARIGFSHVVIQVDTKNCQSDDITCCHL